MIQDTLRHKGLRRRLAEEIKAKGVSDKKVLAAIGKVPRHLFMESSFVQFAYKDKAFPIGAGQTISQPYTVAFQSEKLEIAAHSKILEVGTGSGYQAAVLIEIGARVFTIERQQELYQKTQSFLPTIGYRPHFFYGDGYKGLPTYGPFDGIVVTAGAPFIPEPLKQQLKIGAKLVIPVGAGAKQKMIVVTRKSKEEFEQKDYGSFSFVPLLSGTNNA